VFANAEILVPEPEWTYWMNDANMAGAPKPVARYFLNARRIFKDIAGEVRQFKPGAEVAPGIVSVPAFGHTPGHTAFAIHSGNRSMLAMSDTVCNPYLFARHPEWQPIFDMDGPLAVKTRKRMLDRAVADRMLVEAFHFPFPACGHIAWGARRLRVGAGGVGAVVAPRSDSKTSLRRAKSRRGPAKDRSRRTESPESSGPRRSRNSSC
jgi:glyoxylase-like metal-dependent hydrolase (beta-lactamase superfamily II)